MSLVPRIFIVLVVLETFALSVLATMDCPASISDSVTASIDNDELFSNCAQGNSGLRTHVESLFDVLNFSEANFLRFCRSPACNKPVKTLLKSTPADCLVNYHSLTRNMSKEVSALLHKCANVVAAADQTDEDYIYRYFLDQ